MKTRAFLASLLLIVAASIAGAQAPPRLAGAAPSLLKRGASVTVTFTGERLAGVGAFHVIGEPGLVATLRPETLGPDGMPRPDAKPEDKRLTVRLSVAPDAPLGEREVRVVAPSGASNPLTLTVGLLPEVPEMEPNNSPAEVQRVSTEAAITGVIHAPTEVDHFRFHAVRGQRVCLNVVANRTGSTLDPTLILYAVEPGGDTPGNGHAGPSAGAGADTGPEIAAVAPVCACKAGCGCGHCSGKGGACGCGGAKKPHAAKKSAAPVPVHEIVRSEDAYGLDSFIDFTAPEDGDYIAALRDYQYRGGPDFPYRLEIGPVPVVDSVFPLGGRRGTKTAVTLRGRSLEGVTSMTIAPDARAATGPMPVRVDTPRGPSAPFLFDVEDLPEVFEAEPNDAPARARLLRLPVVVNGCIDRPGDVDSFRFKAEPWTHLILEVQAFRLGSRLDALLTVADTQGKVVAQDDDGAGVDARIDKADFARGAEYTVSLRDLVDRGGEGFAYRLLIHPPLPAPPGLAVRFQPEAVRVHRGGFARIWCEVTRLNGFAGDVALRFKDLPPGITCEPVTVPAAPPGSGVFTLAASADAPTGTVPLVLTATGRIGNADVTRIAEPEIDGRPVRQAFITVLDAPPFTIEPAGGATADETKRKQEEIAVLQTTLDTQTPELEAAQAAWETSPEVANSWTVLKADKAQSYGAALTPQDDGSLLASGPNFPKGNHSVEARAGLKTITAFRLEVIPDPSLPQMGPGRVGNFVLSEFRVLAAPADVANAPAAAVAFAPPIADFSQEGFPIANTIDDKPETGWAIHPHIGKPHSAMYVAKAPVTAEKGMKLTILLEHQSTYAGHAVGRFRVSVTSAAAPALDAITLPASVRALLDVPADRRTEDQKKKLAAYYRSHAPALEPVRNRLAQLKAETSPFPPELDRVTPAPLGVAVRRNGAFHGPVAVSIEGYSAGRDPATRKPVGVERNFTIPPLTLAAEQTHATVPLKAKPDCELGTRNVVLRGEAVVDGQDVVQYSRAFPLTVFLARISGPLLDPPPPTELVNGLDADYYEGVSDTLPDFAALRPVRSAAAEKFDIASRGIEDHFAFAFRGFVDIPRDGVYVFYTKSDDGSRLRIGSTEVVNNDGRHAPEEKHGAIGLKAGKHPITVEFFEHDGGELLEVMYEGPELAKQPIPSAALFRVKR